MAQRTLSTNLALSLYWPGEETEVDATITYDFEPSEDPRFNDRVTVESITVEIGGKAVDVLPLFSAKARARMEADLLRREQEEAVLA